MPMCIEDDTQIKIGGSESMRDELEQKLASKFPFMCHSFDKYGCECGDGWYDLITDLCTEITAVLEELNQPVTRIHVHQVKQKLGELRFYYELDNTEFSDGHDRIREIVRRYTKKSKTVCEHCGVPGTMRNVDNWLVVLCDSHYQTALNVTHENRVKALETVGVGAWVLGDSE